MIPISTKLVVSKGILYILLIKLEGKELVKIGITSRSIQERVCEILTSIWVKYRVFPECYPKRFKEVPRYEEMEKDLHGYFSEYRYKTQHRFSGSTEIFDVELDKVVEKYEDMLRKAGDDKRDSGQVEGKAAED